MSAPHVAALRAEGLRLLAAGRSILPVRGKVPVISEDEGGWKHLQERLLEEKELEELCRVKHPTGISIIGGGVSGGVEVLDFDYKAGRSLWHAFKEKAGSALEGIPFQRTGSGNGFQGAYCCPEPGPNQKLASARIGDPEQHTYACLIETRGEGGYALIPPSVHPDTRREYRYLVGDFVHLPFISQDQRDTLISIARSLNEKVEPVYQPRPFVRPTELGLARQAESKVVIQAYNAAVPITHCLSRAGYSVCGSWAVRPGGKRRTVKIDEIENKSYHNGVNDPMCDGKGTEGYWKRPFDFLMVDHEGDFKGAIRAAAKFVGVELITPRNQTIHLPTTPKTEVVQPLVKHHLIIVTDHRPDLAVCERFCIPAVLSPRHMLIPDVVAAVEPYDTRILVTAPPEDGFAEALAADLRAKLVALPDNLANLVGEGRGSLIDFVSMMRGAIHPVWRPGLGA